MNPPRCLSFYAQGIPKGQPRVRAFRRGNHAAVYDPGTAKAWKTEVKAGLLRYWDHKPFTGPLSVSIYFGMPRPKAHYLSGGRLRHESPTWHTAKPDVDNLAKAVLDALVDAQVFKDDALVVRLHVTKRYTDSKDTGEPITGATVTIEETP
jgi:Holliday junction resolvase RusA-like endonuclease